MTARESKLQAFAPQIFSILRKKKILRTKEDPAFELALVSNLQLRELKKTLLHKDVEIVDVLAFPDNNFPNPESKRRYIGEVYINKDIAREKFSHAVFLLIHGILHLLGYHHEKKRDIIVMEQLEDEVLGALRLK